MNRKSIHIALFALLLGSVPTALKAQNSGYDRMLKTVERNNLSLSASSLSAEAEKLGTRTDLGLADPEASFSYQWGVPSDVPDKINVEVSQTFDFATLSGAKKRLSESQARSIDAGFAAERLQVLTDADNTLTMLAYYTRLNGIYDGWLSQLDQQMAAAKVAFDKGEISFPNYNSLLLDYNIISSDAEMVRIDMEAAAADLALLNGNQPYSYPTADYSEFTLPASFDTWYDSVKMSSPEMLAAMAQIEVSEKELSLVGKQNLPDFSVGYVNELVKDSNYHGFSIGLTVPVWNNSARAKAAKAATAASRLAAEDKEMKTRAAFMQAYRRSASLLRLVENTDAARREVDSREALQKQLDEGVINLSDYIAAIQPFIDAEKYTLDLQRDYQLALAPLRVITYMSNY